MTKINCAFTTIILSMLLYGCASTQRVSALSSTCLQALDAAGAADYNFNTYCAEKSLYQNKIKLEQTLVDGIAVAKLQLPEECNAAAAVDSQAMVLQASLYAYFSGLQQLSDDKLVQYSTEPITTNMGNSSFGGWTLDEKTVAATTTISNMLLKAITGNYRNKKIKLYLTQSDASVAALLDKLTEYYALVGTQITNSSGNIISYYTPFLSESSPYLQQSSRKLMLERIGHMQDAAKNTTAIEVLLQKIKHAHHEVSLKANTMSKSDWQQLVSKEASEIFTTAKALQYLIKQTNNHAASKL